MRTLIAIPTRGRPDGLKRLLASLESQLPTEALSVLVVDNSCSLDDAIFPPQMARHARVVWESRKGVVHVRNRALELREAGMDVVFLDDDQICPDGWYSSYETARRLYPDDVLDGAVEYVFTSGADQTLVRRGFFRRPQYGQFEVIPTAGTGNTSVPSCALDRYPSLRFDARLNENGGEDTLFMSALTKAGFIIRRVNTMMVREPVSDAQVTYAHVFGRRVASGYARGTERLLDGSSRVAVGLQGLSRIAIGACEFVFHFITSRLRVVPAGVGRALSGVGFVKAALGKAGRNYA